MSVKEDRYSGGSWDDPSVQQEIILPRDVFRSKFTHWFYERIHHRRVIVSIFINISIFIYVFMTNSETGELFGTICGGYCLVWTLGVLIYTSSKYHLRNCFELTGQLALMVGVIRTRPSADQKTWDAVAYSLNKVLYERGLWNTPYCLYSGKQAYGMFQELVIQSHIVAKGNNPSQADEEGAGIPFALNLSNYELEKYMRKSLNVFNDAVAEYWRTEYPETVAAAPS